MSLWKKWRDRRYKATNCRLSEMAWYDRLLCISIPRQLLTETCHFNFPARDVMPDRIKITRANMKSNGPDCTTKRWWIYSRPGAFNIDIDSIFFT